MADFWVIFQYLQVQYMSVTQKEDASAYSINVRGELRSFFLVNSMT